MKYLVKLFSLLVKSDKINVPELLVVLLKVKCERVGSSLVSSNVRHIGQGKGTRVESGFKLSYPLLL